MKTLPAGRLEVELEDCLRQLDDVSGQARGLLEGMGPDQLTWRPSEGAWSIAECIDHLNVTARLYLPALDVAIEAGRASEQVGTGPFRYGWWWNRVIRSMEPPSRVRMKAPRRFLPSPTVEKVAEQFAELQNRLAQRIREANGLDLRSVKVVSPVSRFIRISLGACFRFLLAHERRHLWQAQRVRDCPDFPD